jgi:DNA polymerase-1
MLDEHAPIEFDPELLRYTGPDLERQLELFEELEFRRLIPKNLVGGAPRPMVETPRPSAFVRRGPAEVFEHTHYRTITDLEALAVRLEEVKRAKRVALSIVLSSARVVDAEVFGLAFASAPGEVSYVPVGHVYLGCPRQLPLEQVLEAFAPIMRDPGIEKLSGVSKQIFAIFARAGVEVRGLASDVTLASFLLDPDEIAHDVATISRRFLGHDPPAREALMGRGKEKRTLAELPVEEVLPIAGEEADITWRAATLMQEPLEKSELTAIFADIELPLVPVLAHMELAGVRVDTALLQSMSGRFAEELARREKVCYEAAGSEFNLGSPKQLQKILFEDLGLRIVKRTKTGPSTDAAVLEELVGDHALPGAILEYRQVQKLKSTYVDALPAMVSAKTGRVHTVLGQATAATGRLSSTDPNLQNIPIRSDLGRELRKAFIADPGHQLISVDYSQIELRVLAHFSEDPVLTEAFRVNADVHTRTAAALFQVDPKEVTREQRTQAKAVNFGIVYGMGPVRLARDLGIPRRTASKFIEDYFIRQPGVRSYIDQTLEFARAEGYVRTLFGRRRYVHDVRSKNRPIRGAAERVATNTPIQGSAADLIKLAMIRVHARLLEEFPTARLILQVHDELLLEARESDTAAVSEMVKREMEHAFPLKVPLVAEPHAGQNWDQAH